MLGMRKHLYRRLRAVTGALVGAARAIELAVDRAVPAVPLGGTVSDPAAAAAIEVWTLVHHTRPGAYCVIARSTSEAVLATFIADLPLDTTFSTVPPRA